MLPVQTCLAIFYNGWIYKLKWWVRQCKYQKRSLVKYINRKHNRMHDNLLNLFKTMFLIVKSFAHFNKLSINTLGITRIAAISSKVCFKETILQTLSQNSLEWHFENWLKPNKTRQCHSKIKILFTVSIDYQHNTLKVLYEQTFNPSI